MRITAAAGLVIVAALSAPGFGTPADGPWFLGEWTATASTLGGDVSETLKVVKTESGYAITAKPVEPPPGGTPEAGPGATMTGKDIAGIVLMTLFLGTGIAIAVGVAWFEHRTRTRALELLRLYAERSEEPPPSVVQAVTAVSGWPRNLGAVPNVAQPRRSTRGRYLAHVAANTVLTAGLSWLAWWRFSATGEAGAGVIVAIVAALFFAAALAAQLVGAYYAPD